MRKPPRLHSKTPGEERTYHMIWCDRDSGINDATAADNGELQGRTISSATWAVSPTGLALAGTASAAVLVRGVRYDDDTVSSVDVTGGTADVSYTLTNQVTLSDGDILEASLIVPVVSEHI